MTTNTKVVALTFDLFGTIVDLDSSLEPIVTEFLARKNSAITAAQFWPDWRTRQRIEQYQDTLLMLGHSGYLETARRAFVYTAGKYGLETSAEEVAVVMAGFERLRPYVDVVPALRRLQGRYRLVVLSNGEQEQVKHLVRTQVHFGFDGLISVDEVGAFKPHPAVYRRAALDLGLDVGQCLMVSSNSFDVLGARACGMMAAYVNRLGLPYEDVSLRPNLIVRNFGELADSLLAGV